jgi:hypothetical protein
VWTSLTPRMLRFQNPLSLLFIFSSLLTSPSMDIYSQVIQALRCTQIHTGPRTTNVRAVDTHKHMHNTPAPKKQSCSRLEIHAHKRRYTHFTHTPGDAHKHRHLCTSKDHPCRWIPVSREKAPASCDPSPASSSPALCSGDLCWWIQGLPLALMLGWAGDWQFGGKGNEKRDRPTQAQCCCLHLAQVAFCGLQSSTGEISFCQI